MTATEAPALAAGLRPRTGGTRRVGAALAMVAAPWGFVVTNACYALAIRDGSNEDTSVDALALAAAHPTLIRVGVLAMAEGGGRVADYAAVIDATQQQVWTVWVFLLFVVGNLIGTALFAIGLLRSRAVPRWAALGILTWPPLHIIGLAFFGNEVPQVIGAVLQAIGFAGCAMVAMPGSGAANAPRGRRVLGQVRLELVDRGPKTRESGRTPWVFGRHQVEQSTAKRSRTDPAGVMARGCALVADPASVARPIGTSVQRTRSSDPRIGPGDRCAGGSSPSMV